MIRSDTQATLSAARRVVVKVGSALIVAGDAPRRPWLAALAQDVAALRKKGKEVLIVSSGAVALGRAAVGISTGIAPDTIPLAQKQAASAVGQFHLFAAYSEAFLAHNLTAAQVLLTMAETENRQSHLNARAALEVLLARSITPIINENDVVSTGEIRFGDNDRLAVRVAQMVGAEAVVLLSTVGGLYTADPGRDSAARHIPRVEAIGPEHVEMAGEAVPGLSTGGMKSKVAAALSATRAGAALMIADGRDSHCVSRLHTGALRATLFVPQNNPLDARKRWLQAHLHPRGTLTVDAGAVSALAKGGSLLPIGVTKVQGHFRRGDAVAIAAPDGARLGMGLTAYSDAEARALAGRRSAEIPEALGYAGPDTLIHRNDMVLFGV
ncbi:MAG TPA: glutamate 5-kinase [Rhodospirillaceae bacterium]|jgi:glutamate 5-kinase|nr:glutamate 5-kinase [Alphaproteobacteria bacterium]HBH26134.1 glutamate 5-kinase [Rhodospirillaceae bacterium]